jgi:hypothetical protein
MGALLVALALSAHPFDPDNKGQRPCMAWCDEAKEKCTGVCDRHPEAVKDCSLKCKDAVAKCTAACDKSRRRRQERDGH